MTPEERIQRLQELNDEATAAARRVLASSDAAIAALLAAQARLDVLEYRQHWWQLWRPRRPR
jgi:hypothetical protein